MAQTVRDAEAPSAGARAAPRRPPPTIPGLFIRLLKAGPGEWVHLLGAQRALLAAEWALKRRKTGDLLALSGAVWNGASPADADAGGGGNRNVGPGPSLADAGLRAQAARDARAVQIAAKYGVFRPLCLTRAMALQAMLGRRGLHAAVRVGARRNGNQLEAHAWVELDGVVLGDTQEHVAGFAPLGNFNRL